MKMIRKAVSLLLVMVMMSTLCVCASAEDGAPLFYKTYEGQNYVAISGNAGTDYAGYDASVMLVPVGSSATEDTIGYIGQTTISPEGDYLFEFKFDGFTYDENNNVDNYIVVLNVAGTQMNTTIEKASAVKELVGFDLDFSNFGKAVAALTNEYNLQKLQYRLLIGFYDEDGNLLSVNDAKKYTGEDSELKYNYSDVPEGTVEAKGFLWESTERMIPLAASQNFAVKEYATADEAMCLNIAPGSTELERNFAWYELSGMEDIKLQYAVKTSDADLTSFPASGVVTVNATYDVVDVAKYNGAPVSGKLFNYTWDYSWAKASITGLEANTEYVYRVGNKYGWRPGIYTFKTEDPNEVANGFNFIVYTDEHASAAVAKNSLNANRNQALTTYESLFGAGTEPSFIYSLGDVVDWAYDEDAYTNYFDWDKASRIPLAGVVGNHDNLQATPGASVYGLHFNMPNQSTEYPANYAENVGSNYWFTYGDVLFIGLRLGSAGAKDTNEEFIKQVVEANPDQKWRIVCTHYPFFDDDDSSVVDGVSVNPGTGTASKHFADYDYLDKYDIDMTFTGHEHVYYRTHQMNGTEVLNADISINDDGINEVTDPEGVVHFNFNTASWQSLYKDYQRWFEAYRDDEAKQYYGVSGDTEYNSYFATASTETVGGETSLTMRIYKNTVLKSGHEITSTELIDTYKIVKTKDRQ